VDGEVVVERRRQWSPEHKAALLAEVDAEGGQVSVVARRHGVSTSLLYNWRSAWKAAALAARATAVRPAKFVQLGVVADASRVRVRQCHWGWGRYARGVPAWPWPIVSG
jgi:transposase